MHSISPESTVSTLMDEPKSSALVLLQEHSLELTPDGKYVRWLRDHPKHPRNWSTPRKTYDIIVICLLDLFITASSTAGSVAAKKAETEYNISSTLSTFYFVTLFLLGQVAGSVLFPPWSEAFGRKNMYIWSSGLSAICCMVIGLVRPMPVIIAMRIVAGLLSAIPYTIIGGSIEDMFNSRGRIWAMYYWTIASNIGLVIGPILSSFVIAALDWRWNFYVFAIMIASITVALFFIRESRPSLLLADEVKKVTSLTTVDSIPPPLNHDHIPGLHAFVRESLLRPVQLFFREPILFLVAMMIAVSMSLIYIFTQALQPIFESMGFKETDASLIFIAIALGTLLSAFTRVLDEYILNYLRKQGRTIKPEHKLVGLALGGPTLAIGLWWFAWTIPPDVHAPWIVPALSLVLVGYALTELDTVLYGYISDSYLSYSASASAAIAFMRALLSGTFPLFTDQMFDGLGNNVAMSVLAAVATAFCVVPPLFIIYGERIRQASKFARYSWEMQQELGKDEDDF
ncbi:Major facilitator superfamily domain general substrate transporter [Penicillium brevicompactum]|uniref:Major facilitator superfamily domain general substrate transporter n=1 Tax=Penicillium brevicompactum TaxID=5074 RepID=UPI0025400FFB|nr:Major facilitator superfamily domain general substrate transporter [Penicillium brevicompactum]KAJ5333636.1 Major facilitator superfamily domain general substrate transporter [Penicillium brevicompactum]